MGLKIRATFLQRQFFRQFVASFFTNVQIKAEFRLRNDLNLNLLNVTDFL